MRIEKVDQSSSSLPSERVTENNQPARDVKFATRDEVEQQQSSDLDVDVDEEKLESHMDLLNDTLRTFDKRLRFQIHRETEQVYTHVIDIETEEILREIPPEEILDMVARIEEMVGLIIDEKV